MSAICGIYYHGGKPANIEDGMAMLEGFRQYSADDRDYWHKGELFLACHAQHVTPESVGEKLPFYDAQTDLAITADAIIDNRRELFDKLAVSHDRRSGMPDSQLILEAYKKWGKDCPKYLIGDFAFAVWDGKHKELFCAVDALGRRTLYYCSRAGVFAFSTLLKPLFAVPEIVAKFNETWIADFLAIPSVMHQLDPELTIYEELFLLPAGHALICKQDGFTKIEYWRVRGQPELKLASEAEYIEAFLDVFGEAVRCRLRSIRPVGVMMSGGLDSTSVACMAARELAKSGRRLPAFSAVPMDGFQDWLPPEKLADETAYIEAVKKKAGNIDILYCRSEGRHSLSDTGRNFAMLEQPYKIFENLFWIDSILAAARDRDFGVLLDGGGGNITISWGYMHSFALSLLNQGKWLKLLKEVKAYAGKKQRPWGRILASILLSRMSYPTQKAVYWLRNGSASAINNLSPICPSFFKNKGFPARFNHFEVDPLFIRREDSVNERCRMFHAATFSHMAPILTKQSLAYSVVKRDPTLDKRVIEFCLSLPEDQYVRDGEERRFIRQAMKGILPDTVRLNDSVHGYQSADWLQRLLPFWQELSAEIDTIGEQDADKRYLDIERIKRNKDHFGAPTCAMAEDSDMRMLMRALLFSRFLRQGS